MLDIRINNISLKLHRDISIQLNLKNPMFHEMGSHSLSFSIPNTPYNNAILLYPHRIQKKNLNTKEFDNVEIWHSGLLIKSGILTVKETDPQNLTCYFKTDLGEFNYRATNTMLSDVDYGAAIEIGNNIEDKISFLNNILGNDYPDTAFNLPMVFNKNFYGAENPNWVYPYFFLNHYDTVGNTLEQNYIDGSNTKYAAFPIVPMPYILFVLDKLCQHIGFRPKGNIFSHTEIMKIIMYSNVPIDYTEKKYYVRTTNIEGQEIGSGGAGINFTDDTTLPNEDIDNVFDVGGSNNYTISTAGLHEITLDVTVNGGDPQTIEVAIHCENGSYDDVETFTYANGTSYQLKHTINAAEDGIKFYANIRGLNSLPFDLTYAKMTVANLASATLNVLQNNINISNHVPHKTGKNFIDNIKKTFGVVPFVNEITREVHFKFLNDIMADQEVIDISNKAAKDHKILEKTNVYKKFSMDVGWAGDYSQYESEGLHIIPSDVPAPVKIGQSCELLYNFMAEVSNIVYDLLSYVQFSDMTNEFVAKTDGDIEIKPDWITFSMRYPSVDDTNHYINLWPFVESKGSSPTYSTGKNELDKMIIGFFRGIPINYPFATPSKYDEIGTAIGTLNLQFQGTNGLFAEFWETFVYWYNNIAKPVQKTLYYSAADLQRIQWDKKHRIGDMNYYISELPVTLKFDRIEPIGAVLFSC